MPILKEDIGTTVEVRDIHHSNGKAIFMIRKYMKELYDTAVNNLSVYSFILKDVSLAVTCQMGQSPKDLKVGRKLIKTYWVKPEQSTLKANVRKILKN